jgi:HlyD family secretion protein
LKTKKTFWRVGLLIVTAAAVVFFVFIKPKLAARKIEYTFVTLKKGLIESTISSTGTLEAINTLQVGTQISGTISKIYADYNDRVKAGQLLAEIDIRLLNAALMNAQANLSVVSTRLKQAEEEFKRNRNLFEKKVITEKEFKDTQYNYEQTLSNKRAAEASVKSADVNLGYAYIKSPIAGTITERNIEEGQTVAASFATPTLFVIAEDLSKMQILANVDESDIGYIEEGMKVRFTVQTYPDKKFFGAVTQIRLQPVNINNVVNYKVVIGVSNEQGLLLPGMTASLDFISESSEDALLINNSALRFHPNELMLKKIKPVLVLKAKGLPDSVRSPFLTSLENEEVLISGGFRKVLPRKINGIFYQTSGNKVDFDFVNLGITTGLQSEVTSLLNGSPLPSGVKIINGIKSKEK